MKEKSELASRWSLVIRLPAFGDYIAQIEGISKEGGRQTETGSHDTENEEHVVQHPAAHFLETVEKDHPEDEIETVVEHHAQELGDEGHPEFKRSL